ncbi:MAG: hypothetical protein ABJA67_05035 [Chthonomonadales bacterium]
MGDVDNSILNVGSWSYSVDGPAFGAGEKLQLSDRNPAVSDTSTTLTVISDFDPLSE